VDETLTRRTLVRAAAGLALIGPLSTLSALPAFASPVTNSTPAAEPLTTLSVDDVDLDDELGIIFARTWPAQIVPFFERFAAELPELLAPLVMSYFEFHGALFSWYQQDPNRPTANGQGMTFGIGADSPLGSWYEDRRYVGYRDVLELYTGRIHDYMVERLGVGTREITPGFHNFWYRVPGGYVYPYDRVCEACGHKGLHGRDDQYRDYGDGWAACPDCGWMQHFEMLAA
jgi:hypothetical protein